MIRPDSQICFTEVPPSRTGQGPVYSEIDRPNMGAATYLDTDSHSTHLMSHSSVRMLSPLSGVTIMQLLSMNLYPTRLYVTPQPCHPLSKPLDMAAFTRWQ